MAASSSASSNVLLGRKVLVAEDEAILADELTTDLEELGAVVIGAAVSVEEALLAIDLNPDLDAALLNVHLRAVLSFPIADELRRRNIPFLFVTANDGIALAQYPEVPRHPKPSDMPRLIKELGGLLPSRDHSPDASAGDTSSASGTNGVS